MGTIFMITINMLQYQQKLDFLEARGVLRPDRRYSEGEIERLFQIVVRET